MLEVSFLLNYPLAERYGLLCFKNSGKITCYSAWFHVLRTVTLWHLEWFCSFREVVCDVILTECQPLVCDLNLCVLWTLKVWLPRLSAYCGVCSFNVQNEHRIVLFNFVIICTDAGHVLKCAMTHECETSETVVYPLLCKLVLHLTARFQNVVNYSADHTVITNVLFSLISVARKSILTTVCLYQQVVAFMCAGQIRLTAEPLWNWADREQCLESFRVIVCPTIQVVY